MLNKFVTTLISAVALSACSTIGTHTTEGVVIDATMNTLIITDADHRQMSFSTAEADRSALRGLLIGDTVRVQYKG